MQPAPVMLGVINASVMITAKPGETTLKRDGILIGCIPLAVLELL